MSRLRQALYQWRDNESARRGVEVFRILTNNTIDEIGRILPGNKEELVAIKGIKEAKYREFGKTILEIVKEYGRPNLTTEPDVQDRNLKEQTEKSDEPIYSVGDYLGIVNMQLARLFAKVRGELTSIKIQGAGVYLGLKDSDDGSSLNVFMWKREYELFGLEVLEGMEVVVEGRSEIYKPNGRFNFRAQSIALVGEGALKKAYEELKKKLLSEGLFEPERKKSIPQFSVHIGLITSKQGAVIHDFLNNLGRFGYHISFVDSRVEGQSAVKDLLSAIAFFKKQPIDVLVIIRGGGSLESLQAFNNEQVVRAIADFPHPTVIAIGHDKDVPLLQMVADAAPSTPTACTMVLNQSWEDVLQTVALTEKNILSSFNERLSMIEHALDDDTRNILGYFDGIKNELEQYSNDLRTSLAQLREVAKESLKKTGYLLDSLYLQYKHVLGQLRESLHKFEAEIEISNPLRQLKLGYSILSKSNNILRSVRQTAAGDHFEARLGDGTLEATVVRIIRTE